MEFDEKARDNHGQNVLYDKTTKWSCFQFSNRKKYFDVATNFYHV